MRQSLDSNYLFAHVHVLSLDVQIHETLKPFSNKVAHVLVKCSNFQSLRSDLEAIRSCLSGGGDLFH